MLSRKNLVASDPNVIRSVDRKPNPLRRIGRIKSKKDLFAACERETYAFARSASNAKHEKRLRSRNRSKERSTLSVPIHHGNK